MNKKLGLAVAGALVAFSSAANAGITIPAGDWTVDIGGNVNAYYTHTSFSGTADNFQNKNMISTGLLPSALGIGAKTRQNDLDIAFQFTFFTGVNAGNALGSPLASSTNSRQGVSTAAGGNSLNIRQAFMTVGDASWGSFKLGRDLGVFGSDAILSDMTLLGVGNGAGGQGSSTLGRIGSGYVYADWIGQIQYTTPNWNGLQFTAAIREPLSNTLYGADPVSYSSGTQKTNLGFDGKVTYDFAANDVTGRVWLGGLSQKHEANITGETAGYTSRAVEVGAKVAYQGAQLVGYYYDGRGLDGQLGQSSNGSAVGGLQFLSGEKTHDSGGYVQATYVVPGVGTKLGASWGISNSKAANGSDFEIENESWIVGAYHPLTKNLNIVAEYTNADVKDKKNLSYLDQTAKTVSLGAILFF